MKSKWTVRQIARGGVIAAVYAALAYVSGLLGIGFGALQFRLSEALCVLPFLLPEAVPGLALGCLVSNLLSPYGALDLIFGTLATLLAAILTRRVRTRALTPAPAVLCNALIVGAVIAVQEVPWALFPGTFAYHALTVGLGEAAVCWLLGLPLLCWLERTPALTEK